MDVPFLKQVQEAGWLIDRVDKNSVDGACPRAGCSLRVKLRQGAAIPTACGGGVIDEMVIQNFEDARVFLLNRRQRLALSISDVEHIAGMTPDYLAKFGKENPSKIPNAQTFLEWAQALGMEVVFRPARLPQIALRQVADTRALAPARVRQGAKRLSGGQSG